VLRHRVITALILVPLVVASVLGLPTPLLAVLFGGVMLLAAWEWAALAGFTRHASRLTYCALIAAALGLVWLVRDAVAPGIVLFAAAWWAVALAWVITYQVTGGRLPAVPGVWTVRLLGPLVLVPSWLALLTVHADSNAGPAYALYLLVLIWVADSAAYFAGRRWGRRRLATHVSPGKSWEGVVGGLLFSLLLALAVGGLFGYRGAMLAGFTLLGGMTVAVSVLGDLFESLLKRYRQVKDSGGLLPGHGGILDRIDSLTAAAPLYLCGLWLLGGAA